MTEQEIIGQLPRLTAQIGRRFPGQSELCEDILYDTLLCAVKLMRSGYQIRTASAGTILYTIAARRTNDHIRTKYKETRIPLRVLEDEPTDSRSTLGIDVQGLLSILTMRQRQALVWYALGLTSREIAWALGVSASAIHKYRMHARHKICKKIRRGL